MMKKLLFALLLLPVMATASPLTITFNKLLLVTRNSPYGGCETSTQGYTFDVTMLGWNLGSSRLRGVSAKCSVWIYGIFRLVIDFTMFICIFVTSNILHIVATPRNQEEPTNRNKFTDRF